VPSTILPTSPRAGLRAIATLTLRRAFPALAGLLLLACSAGRELQVRADYVSGETHRIHDAAVKCAEREIAMAESNLDFGQYEMQRGNYLRARDHLDVAYQNVEAAAHIVDAHPECWPGYVGDADGDGILDNVDQCPNDPEDFDQFQDEDGCPDPDNDNDGIPDVSDQCPNDPEDFDLFQDEDGCPDEHYEYATLTDTTIEISQQIHFALDSSRILPDSDAILDEVADILTRHPTIQISIEGHTSSEGSTSHNQRLSEDRAGSVRAYLIQAGIDPSRMTSVGYGESRLLVSPERSQADRAANRRVEFHITAR
jgi:OOP family OmpA-OmpF porin